MRQPPTALVTGTSSGLGRGVAERLVDLGWDVLGTVREDTAVLPFATVECDVTQDDAVDRLGQLVLEKWGRLDALVNSAGALLTGPLEEMAPVELRRHLDVNLVAPLALTRACMPALRAGGGVVVQVSSGYTFSASKLFSAYTAAKLGLEGASEVLAAEVALQGVRVVIVEPGPFRTKIASNGLEVAARGKVNLYKKDWRFSDLRLNWYELSSPDASACIHAIVGAVTRTDAPFRIPVGKGMADAMRQKGLELVAQAAAADAFLDSL